MNKKKRIPKKRCYADWDSEQNRQLLRRTAALLATYKRMFRGRGEYRPGRPTEIRIGDSVVIVSDGGGLRESAPAFLYVYVEDTDSTYRRAIEANAVSIEAPTDMPYGDRRAMVKDDWGNTWQIATHIQDLWAGAIRSG